VATVSENGYSWLVGVYGTVALYRLHLYRTSECVVNVNVSAISRRWACSECESGWVCRVGGAGLHNPSCGVEPPCTFGECAEFDGVKPFYTPEQLAYSPPPRGQIRHNDIMRNLSNTSSAGEYAMWMRVSVCRSKMGLHFSTPRAVGELYSCPQGAIFSACRQCYHLKKCGIPFYFS